VHKPGRSKGASKY